MVIVYLPNPTAYGNTYDGTYVYIWKQEVGYYMKDMKLPESILQNTYSLVHVQYSDGIRSKLEII